MTEIANIMDKNIKVKHIFYTGLLVLGGAGLYRTDRKLPFFTGPALGAYTPGETGETPLC